MANWAYRVLGGNALTVGNDVIAPERKVAGMLVYLALEGPSSRQKLAGLLWPDVDEARARNSLAQALRRLRRATDPDIATGDAILELHPDLEVDAVSLKQLLHGGRAVEALSRHGDLLPHYEFDDCPEFDDWLQSERETLRNLMARALAERIAALEREGAHAEALELTDPLIALDPLAEAPYRQAMRLHYLTGDRSAALKVYVACRSVLQRELGVEPIPETQALAKLIQQARLPHAAPARSDALPLEVRHPPLLVGRAREWALMEEGWSKGQTVMVHGPAGVGKTRLMTEFAASKGSHLVTEGRPGDASAPYTSIARVFRRFLKAHPDEPVEPWIRQELSRFLPEVSDAPALPVASPQEQLRFEEALFQLHQRIVEKYDTIVVDDLQFYDASSYETAARYVNRLPAEGLSARTIVAFRTDEVPEDYLRNARMLAERDQLTMIELAPLDCEATATFVGSLNLPNLEGEAPDALATALHRYTGGNPLFVLETLRYLIETGSLGDRLPGQLPPGRVGAIIQQRLERLSPSALRAAQAAAVLETDFDIELVAGVLELRALELVSPWEELEAASVVQGNRFSHDLVRVAVRDGISPAVRALLAQRAAAVLAATDAPAARVADLWLAAGKRREAMHAFSAAGMQAEAGFRLLEARTFYRRAAVIAEELGDAGSAFAALSGEIRLSARDDTSNASLQLIERLGSVARTVEEQAEVHELTAMHLSARGEPARAEAAARAGLELLDGRQGMHRKAALLQRHATALWDLNRYEEALAALQEALALLRPGASDAELAEIQLSISAVLNRAWRNAEALDYQRQAHETFRRLGDKYMTTIVLMYIGVSQESLGRYSDALETYLEAESGLQAIPGTARHVCNNRVNLGYLYFGLEDYAEALRCLTSTSELDPALAHSRALLARTVAQVYLVLGQQRLFDAEIAQAVARPDHSDPWRSHAKILWAAELARRGRSDEARELFRKTEAALAPETGAVPILPAYLWLARARSFEPEAGLRDVERAKTLIAARGLDVLQAEAELRHAQVLLAAGRAGDALAHVERAHERHAEIPLFGQYADLPFTRYRILQALGRDDAYSALAHAHDHVQRVAARHVPESYMESFLTANPLNAAIVEAYREASAKERLRRAG